MVSDSNKWAYISQEVMTESQSTNHRNGAARKSKWNQLILDYKRIVDFLSWSGTNEMA